MADLNRVILAGRLTRDPEVRYTSSGSAVTELGLAVSDNYRNKAGELIEQTCFADIVVWGRQAETCGEYLSKGSPALIEGRLQFDQWENKQGEKRSKLRVKADRVQFLGSPRREAQAEAADHAVPTVATTAEPSNPAPDFSAQDDENLPF